MTQSHGVGAILDRLGRSLRQRVVELSQPSAVYRDKLEEEFMGILYETELAPGYAAGLTKQTCWTQRKNRYQDVIPLEMTRVKLDCGRGEAAGDYINASHIKVDGPESSGCYIAASAPIPSVIGDFWQMVWEYKVELIVMLTRCVEGHRAESINRFPSPTAKPNGVTGTVKADQYWPSPGAAMDWGSYSVISAGEEVVAEGVTKRTLTLQKAASARTVTQLQFSAWPDHGVPKDYMALNALLTSYHELRGPTPLSPALIHCSAGIGRTGSFIALDVISRRLSYWKQALCNATTKDELEHAAKGLESAVDIPDIVKQLKLQRPGMVQVKEQYYLIYRYTLLELLPRIFS